MSTKERGARIRERLEPLIAREGYELIDVELASEQRRAILRLFIDTVPPGTREHGVTVDDCSHVSRLVGDVIDVEELMDGAYHLEVSSPGLYRALTKPEHFARALGERVRVKTAEKLDGRRVFTGFLKRQEGGSLVVEVDGEDHEIPLSKVAKANLEPAL